MIFAVRTGNATAVLTHHTHDHDHDHDHDTNKYTPRFWLAEARAAAERLALERAAPPDAVLAALEAQVADRAAQVAAARERVEALRAAVLRGERAAQQLLDALLA